MADFLERTKLVLNNIESIKGKKVLIAGVGGVGGYTLEALVRSGIENISIIDADVFMTSNLNRQILATIDTVGKKKVDVAFDRAKSINPNVNITKYDFFYDETTKDKIDISKYDYVIDAIDSVKSKVLLISEAKKYNVPIISCMGTGNKTSTVYYVDDIYNTSICPLAKTMRKELKDAGIDSLKVVYSKEAPIKPQKDDSGKVVVGSVSFSPAIAGLTIAAEVIKELLQ